MMWTLGSNVDSGVTRPFFTLSADLLAAYPYDLVSFSHVHVFWFVLCHKGAIQEKPQKKTTQQSKHMQPKQKCKPKPKE